MGGKQNRTRNNVRPSNSGRSAAMLNSSLPQFSGFSGEANKSSGLSPFAFNLTDDVDASIDDNFQLVLKKVSKKDCTTKLKGLQEFAELVQNAEVSIVKTLLPTWPRFYSVLVIHPDNRIREATQNVHHIIVLKVKRDIAPYLKQLMAPWYTSQYDNYPPAAAAAIQAFKDTFSSAKFKEAVNFCHYEIINYIHDNLLNQSAQTVASNQLSPEEADARYERVIISCLQGYAMYLNEVAEEKITESLTLNTQIVTNKKFAKLATSKVPLVRLSWFQALSVVLQKAVYLLKSKESQMLSIILNSLEDDEVTVLPLIWECLLLATSIPDWWNHVNIDQHFIPKILIVLKHAGNGNAGITYPNLLPLLSNVPSMEEKKKNQFYISFFENMCTGIRLKSVASSIQESKAVAVAYTECLQFLISKNVPSITLCKTLIQQLCNLIEWCLSKEAISYNTIFAQATNFVKYLRRNSNVENIQSLIEYFFNLLYDIFYRSLTHPHNDNWYNDSSIAGKQIELTLSLKKIDLVNAKQQVHPKDDTYSKHVREFGVKLFRIYLHHAEQASSNDEIFEQLNILISGFDRTIIFGSLLEQLKPEVADPGYMDIYSKWFKPWLLSDTMYCRSILDLIFLLIPDLAEAEKQIILDDLMQVNQADCVTWSVSRALARPYVEDPVVQKWLKGETAGHLFMSIAEKYISNECSPELAGIFKSALAENSHGELLMGTNVLKNIIEKISSTILSDTEETTSLDSCCNLAAHICTVIYTKTQQLMHKDQLLLALFSLWCKYEGANNVISEKTISELNTVWIASLSVLLQNLNDCDSKILIENLILLIEDNFRLTLIGKHRGHICHLNYVVRKLVDTIHTSRSCLLTWLVEFLFEKSWVIRENIVGMCKIAEYVKGTLDSPYDTLTVQYSIDEGQLLRYFIYNFLKIQVLGTVLNDTEELDAQESSDEDAEETSSTKIRIFDFYKNPADNLLDLVYSYTITDTFLKHFNNVKYYNEINYYHYLFEQRIYAIFKHINEDRLEELKGLLKDKCLNDAWLWCKATYTFYKDILKTQDMLSVYNELKHGTVETNSIGILHLDQIFKDVLEADVKANTENVKMATIFAQIESLRNENLAEFLYEHSDMSWQRTNAVIKAVKQCTVLMEHSTLTRRHWDFVVLSLVSWITNCLKAKRLLKQYQYQSLLVSVTELYKTIYIKIAKLKEEQTETSYVNEWEDILFEGIHADVARIWIFLTDHFSKNTEDPLLNLPLLQSFGKVTDFLRHELIFNENDDFPKWTKFLKISCTLLTNSEAMLQLLGYKMLLIMAPGLVKIDDEAVNSTTPHRNGLIFEQFKEKLLEVEHIVNSVLVDFRIGENSCKVEPSYDSFTYTFAYLLLWDVMLCLCEKASAELRYQYSDWLKNGSLLQQFLSNLFKLMPSEVLHHDEGKIKSFIDRFSTNPVDSTCYSKFCGSDTIENLACYLYKSSLQQFPALVRQWWTVLDMKTSQMVEKVTGLYVSPHICIMELNNVVAHQNSFKNLKVKVMPTVREIQAVYTVDETQMELTITLPANYPLGSPNILCNRQISGAYQKQWLLQFKKCVLHQNGKIWDGLSLWNSNLDRKFDGVEECYICYAVLHSGTYQMPKLCCRTCKKKFHSSCLYKWFSTSNKSSCPICRNLF